MFKVLKLLLILCLVQPYGWAVAPKHLEEFWIGLYLSNQIERENKILDKHKEIERVMDIAMRIIDQAGKENVYNIAIIKAPVANAFALPGGFIFITDKLLELKLSDGELAFLLGHELSHVQNRHFERIQKEAGKVSFLNALATLGAVLLAVNTRTNDYDRLKNQGALNKNVGPPEDRQAHSNALPTFLAPILAGNIFGTLYLLHSQRDFEYEADLSGAKLAMQAGYTLEDGIGMLKKLFYANYRDMRYESWTTHPLTQGRMQALKDKCDPSWYKPKAPDAYIEQLRQGHANKIMNIYEDSPLWQKPSFMRDTSINELRPQLLRRARLMSQNNEAQQRAISLEIRHQLVPDTQRQSMMLAPYGLIEQKWIEFEKFGGHPPEEIIKEVRQNAADNLKAHRQQMQSSSPGYQKLEFLLKNFPNAEEAKEWEWQRWVLEPDAEKAIDQAPKFLAQEDTKVKAQEQIRNLSQKDRQKIWIYRKGLELLNEKPDPKVLKTRLDEVTELDYRKDVEDSKDLEDVVRFLSEFPEDENIELVFKKKRDLINQAYRAGRLASLSQQPEKAIAHFQKILMYDTGSELEEDVREQIYRLNTLKAKSPY